MRHAVPAQLFAMVGVVLALSLVGCGTGAPMTEPSTPSPSERPPFLTATPGPVGPSGTPTEVPPARWDAITSDLGDRGVSGEVVLVSAEQVTWPNGALGCPQPGNSYTQSLVDGMRVVVSAAQQTYDYRFGTGDVPLLCLS